jgi:hypothetical protein
LPGLETPAPRYRTLSIMPHSPAEDSYHRLNRSGWSCGEAAFTGSSGRAVWRVDGSDGENKLRVEGATPAEAWHRAVEAAACGMLSDWPWPSQGLG